MTMKNVSLPFLAFLQASALVAYILIVSTLMSLISERVPQEDTVFSPVVPLLLFVVSAVISAGIVLGRAGQLYMRKELKAAYQLVGWTVGWMLVYFLLFVLVLIKS